jgi:hypothetical protein
VVNSVEYGPQARNFSIGLSGGQWRLLATPTPGAANSAAASLGAITNLRFNEWMASPIAGEDWFELYNLDASPVALAGLYLTDSPSMAGLSNTPIAALSFMGGRDWLRWNADGDRSRGRNHTAFSLSKEGETLRLYAPDFSVIDSVTFGLQETGVSEGRLPDGGNNIVRFPNTPTPEASNYLPLDGLVINEVLTHTDPPLEDAIELLNTSSNSLAVGGWWISNSERELKKFRVPPGTALNAGAFKVFYEGDLNPSGTGIEPAATRFIFHRPMAVET